MKIATCILLILIFATTDWARDFRIVQVPNGNKFNCTTCHNGYGGSRNIFGQQIEANYLDENGNVLWGAELAIADADEDGGSNGVELLDPDGTWQIGDENPGDFTLVTNPGNAASVSAVHEKNEQPIDFSLLQNYPNPFNNSTRISVQIANKEFISIKIYNMLGSVQKILANRELEPGTYNYIWDGRTNANEELQSGIYFCVMQTATFSKTIRMLMLK